MEAEIIQASKQLSPIIVASIAAITGLISGAVGSLVAPWVQHAVESKRKAIEYRERLIKETRTLLDRTKTLAELRRSSMWGFISDNLNESEQSSVFPDGIVIEISGGVSDNLSQDDHRKQGISDMLARLEKEWSLTKT